MTALRRTPPGRAGRLWLRRRLAAAERGREQLDRKLHILLTEAERLQRLAVERRERWHAAGAAAETWYERSVLLGGEDEARRSTARQRTEVTVSWTTSAGLRYPSDATCGFDDSTETSPKNAATIFAIRAYREAIAAAALSAVADDAVRRMTAEIAVTRQRLRALDKRWLPELHAALVRLDLSLEQAEQEDAARLRRTTGRTFRTT